MHDAAHGLAQTHSVSNVLKPATFPPSKHLASVIVMDQTAGQSTQQCDPSPPRDPLPAAPNPSADPGVVPQIGEQEEAGEDRDKTAGAGSDVVQLDPLGALRLLSRGMQALSEMTGDVPPTPPISRPGTPSAGEIRAQLGHRRAFSRPANAPSNVPSSDVETSFRKSALGSPEAHVLEPDGITEVCDGRAKAQHDAISRKFFSKKPPPISVNDYLLRMHRYCPMSTAVYLAAGTYIYKMAIEDRSVPVTSRTVHRVLLASLRVAMKALEDLSYPHKRFAGVGGVSERELAKLEISVCYLMDFDLRVTTEKLQEKATALHQFASAGSRLSGRGAMQLQLPTRSRSSRRLTVS